MPSDLKSYLDHLTQEIVESLQKASEEYFKIGFATYEEVRQYSFIEFQPAVGNLSIAIELLLKSIVAKKSFKFLYTNLPLEAQIILAYPDSMPRGTNFNSYMIDIKCYNYKTIELDQAITLFYTFYPELKQDFKPHLSVISAVRNVSVHASIPSFQRYQLDRVAYIAAKLYQFAKSSHLLYKYSFKHIENIDKIIQQFDSDRSNRVHEAIEAARKGSKSIEHLWSFVLSSDEWESKELTCPICGNEGLAFGYTEEDSDDERQNLTFYLDSFECDSCGLKLNDPEELRLAGIDSTDDISHKLDKWNMKHHYEE